MMWYGIIAYLIPSSLIWALYSRLNSGPCYAISYKSKENSLRLSILKPMAKQRDKTTQWRYTSELFVNWEQNDWAHFLPIAEFVYNNAKNANTGHIPFKLNCGFHPRVFFKDNIDPYSRSRSANKLAKELKDLINICQQNLFHA